MAKKKNEPKTVNITQRVGAAAWNKLTQKIDQASKQHDIFKRSGLQDAANKALEVMRDLQRQRHELEKRLEDERRQMSACVLTVLASCDLMCSVADGFAEDMHRLSHGYYANNNSLAAEARAHATSFNKLVQSVDIVGNERMSMFYADMAEEVIEAVTPKIKEIVQKYMESEKGRRYF